MMSRDRTVVCATDFSEKADLALREAASIARHREARLLALHVQADPTAGRHPVSPPAQPALYSSLPGQERGIVEALVSKVRGVTDLPPDAFDAVVDLGDPYSTIVKRAEAAGAELLVIGSQGGTGLHRVLVGSVAERVVRLAHSPVLVVRSGGAGGVLAATDFSDPSLPAIAAAAREAERRGTSLHILHSLQLVSAHVMAMDAPAPYVAPEGLERTREEARTLLRQAADRFAPGASLLLTEGPAAVDIVRTATTLEAQLVVVGTAGRTGLSRMLLGSVAEAVVRLSPCSVLVERLGLR